MCQSNPYVLQACNFIRAARRYLTLHTCLLRLHVNGNHDCHDFRCHGAEASMCAVMAGVTVAPCRSPRRASEGMATPRQLSSVIGLLKSSAPQPLKATKGSRLIQATSKASKAFKIKQIYSIKEQHVEKLGKLLSAAAMPHCQHKQTLLRHEQIVPKRRTMSVTSIVCAVGTGGWNHLS